MYSVDYCILCILRTIALCAFCGLTIQRVLKSALLKKDDSPQFPAIVPFFLEEEPWRTVSIHFRQPFVTWEQMAFRRRQQQMHLLLGGIFKELLLTVFHVRDKAFLQLIRIQRRKLGAG